MTQNNRTKAATGPKERDVREAEAELDATRDAISNDLRVLGDKLSPEQLKAQAKEALDEAKDAAADKLREVKHASVEKLREAKNAAADTVTEAAEEVAEGARRASDASVGFVRENAVPLALIGVGAAWLFSKYRREDGWKPPGRTSGRITENRGFGSEMRQARSRINDAGSRARHAAHDALDRAEHAVSNTGARARDAVERQYQRTRQTSRELADTNPLALGAMAVAAGVGVGLLLPATQKENDLLGASRDRLLGQAKQVATQAEEAASEAKHAARDAANEAKRTVSGLGSTK